MATRNAENETVEATEAQEQNAKAQIMFSLPPQMKVLIENKAKDEEAAVADFVRRTLAAAVGYEGPLQNTPKRVTKYASPEEKAAAMKAKAKEKRDLINQLLARYREEQNGASAS